jgi:hypothetical protein
MRKQPSHRSNQEPGGLESDVVKDWQFLHIMLHHQKRVIFSLYAKGFYQVRQGRTWSRNYKSPSSSSSSSSSSDRIRIFSKFQDEFLRTFCRLFDNFLTTFWQLVTNFWQLFDNLLPTFDNFLTPFYTFCQLFENLFYNFLTIFNNFFNHLFYNFLLYNFLLYNFCHTFLPLVLVVIRGQFDYWLSRLSRLQPLA